MNQEVVEISGRRFGTTYHFSLCNNPEERSSQDAILLVSHEVSNGNTFTSFAGCNKVMH
jgi:hypothetical protein